MQLTAIIVGAVAALVTGASGATVSVVNMCSFPVYLQSVPNDGSQPTPVKKLATGRVYSEAYRMPAGSDIKVSLKPKITQPLAIEYSPSNNIVYYSLDDDAGNPFAAYRNQLTPANRACPQFDCAANSTGCYSNGANPKIKSCGTTKLKAVLCAP